MITSNMEAVIQHVIRHEINFYMPFSKGFYSTRGRDMPINNLPVGWMWDRLDAGIGPRYQLLSASGEIVTWRDVLGHSS